MKLRLIAITLGMMLVAGTVPAGSKDLGSDDPQMRAMKEAMEKFGTPGPEHKLLARYAGTWDVESKMWMDPAAPPSLSFGSSTYRTILGGRYIQFDYEGEAMGKPFTGFGLSGYDRKNQKFISLWVDSWGTAFYPTEGTCDAQGKVCTETGTWDDCVTGKKVDVRNVITHYGPDKFTMQMFMTQPDGKEVQTMEMTYTRRK